MVPPPFTGGSGDKSLMFKSPVRMTSSNSDFLKDTLTPRGIRGGPAAEAPLCLYIFNLNTISKKGIIKFDSSLREHKVQKKLTKKCIRRIFFSESEKLLVWASNSCTVCCVSQKRYYVTFDM